MQKFNPLISKIIFLAIIFLVLLNLFTPLRLITDGIRYLNILEYLQGHHNKNSSSATEVLPHGYPLFLLLLNKLSILNPAIITMVNILSMLAASMIMVKLFNIENRLIYYSTVFISFICIKQFTLPLSDELFTLLFIASIYLWTLFFKGKYYFIIPAMIITLLSLYIRTAGVAIFAGVFLYIIYLNSNSLFKNKLLLTLTTIGIFVFLTLFIINLNFFEHKVDYVRQLDLETIVKKPFSIINRVSIHLQELGEITINIPLSKLATFVHTGSFNTPLYILIIVGVAALFIAGRMVFKLTLFKTFSFWVFLSYLLMIFLWPFYDTRFLIPLTPLFVYFFLFYLFGTIKTSYLKIVPFAVYIIFGLLSLGYSDALSLSKPFFLKHYGIDKSLTHSYEVHFQNQKLSPINRPHYSIDKDNKLYLLEKYDHKPFSN